MSPSKILLIDDHADNRALLARTLFRKFPRVTIQECHDLTVAVGAAAIEDFDAIILHRSDDADAVMLVEALRKVDDTVPIIVVSGVDRSELVRAAGATSFLHFDEWLRIGTHVSDLLESKLIEKDEAPPAMPGPLPSRLTAPNPNTPSERN